MEVRRLTGRIGAEIHGVDVAAPLDSDTVAALRVALSEHKALVFADTGLDDAGQQRFAAQFGPLTTAHPTVAPVDGQPNVMPVDGEGGRSNHWHTDVTFIVNPPQASTLRAVVVPAYGGETLIANTAAAYRDLPAALRAFADTLWAVHSNDAISDTVDSAVPDTVDSAALARRAEFVRIRYRTVHPVVRVHPLTGERGLFLGTWARRIVGLPAGESHGVLRLLQSAVSRPENVVRCRWSPGQLVLFDNRITQHYAVDNYDDQPRRLHRVTVAGDVPVGVDGTSSRALEGDASHYTPAPAN